MQVGNLPEGFSQEKLVTVIAQTSPDENLVFATTAEIESNVQQPSNQLLVLTNVRILFFNLDYQTWMTVAQIGVSNHLLALKNGTLQIQQDKKNWLTCRVEDTFQHEFERALSEVFNVQPSESDFMTSNKLAARALALGKVAKEGMSSAIEKERVAQADRKEKREAEMRRLAARQAELTRETGPSTASATFPSAWMASVTIYQKGYIRVKGATEKLVAISATDGTVTKSALGRGLGAVATGGLNMYGSKLRGQAYLIIATDQRSLTIHLEAPSPKEISDLHRIVAAGQAAIDANANISTATPNSSNSQSSLSEQLQQLVDLHEAGALTDDEFTSAKARLLRWD